MKTSGYNIVLAIIFSLTVTGCSQSTHTANTEIVTESNIPSGSNATNKTSVVAPKSIVVVSKNNLDEWSLTPQFSTSKSGHPMVDMTIKYQGNYAPAKMVKISFGNASSELNELRNSDHIVLGTSFGDDTKLTFSVSWNEGNQNMQGTEVLSIH